MTFIICLTKAVTTLNFQNPPKTNMICIIIPRKVEILANNMMMSIPINTCLIGHNHHTVRFFLENIGKNHRIPYGLDVILVSVVGVVIVFLLTIFVLFIFLLEAVTFLWFVNCPERSILSVTFTTMVSFYILFLVYFSIISRSIHPTGNLEAPSAALSRNNIFCLGDFRRSLDFLYFSLQYKHWVFYLVVSL